LRRALPSRQFSFPGSTSGGRSLKGEGSRAWGLARCAALTSPPFLAQDARRLVCAVWQVARGGYSRA
jgi:hypothetical protein